MACGLALLAGALLLGTIVPLVDTQQIVVPEGSLNGPTPFVGAYYFNWYNLEDQWKRYSQTRHPVLGHYDQSDPSVLAKHHEWGKQAGIDFFAMAWSGGGSDLIQWERADEIDRRIASHLKIHDGVKVALMYNIRDFVQAGSHGKIDLAEENYCTIMSDHLAYAARTHMQEGNYFRIGENPVIFLYTLRDYVNFAECLKLALERMMLESGVVPYIIGDVVWWSPAADKLDWNDYRAINVSAVTAFSTYDAGQPARMGHAFAWDNAQLFHDMITPAWGNDMIVIPSVLPGFDDRHLRGAERPFIDRAHGAELVQQWKQVLWYARCQTMLVKTVKKMQRNLFGFDFKVRPRTKKGRQAMEARGAAQEKPPIIMINSFNEWHDGTEIEPSTEEGESMLKLLGQLKHEVQNEELSCGKEKDKNFRAPKFIIPKQFQGSEFMPADKVFVTGMSVVMWFFLMSVIWMCAGHIILLHTGRAPNKYKDDDFGGRQGGAGGILTDFAPSCLPTEAFVHPSASKYPKRVPTVSTLGALMATGVASYLLIFVFFNHSPVVAWFDKRAATFERKGHSNVRRAREVAHKLCPALVLNMHKAKFEEWVRKLAANQISQLEFMQEMCGDKGLHTREIEALYLELLGREPEPQGLEHYEKAIEEGRMHLDDVRLAIQNSPESTEHQQQTQMRKTKIYKTFMEPIKGAREAIKRLAEEQVHSRREETLGSLDMLEHRMQELMNEGKIDEANELMAEYRSSVVKGRGNKGPRRMGKEEGSHHDSLMDEWDVA